VVEMSNLTLQEQLEVLKLNMFTDIKENSESNYENKINIANDKIHSKDFKLKEVAMNKINYNKRNLEINRGDIWMVDLGSNGNNIQSGIHPFLVTSNILNNRYSPNITGCSGTSSMSKPKLPVHTLIEAGMFGLPKTTIILAETLCPISKSKFLYKIGTANDEVMKQVKRAIDIQNGELKPKTELEKLSEESQKYIISKIKMIETCKTSLKIIYSMNGDRNASNLFEDRIFEEENALRTYCYNNEINYEKMYENYFEIYSNNYEKIAI
jgi:mRNA interferase MazF